MVHETFSSLVSDINNELKKACEEHAERESEEEYRRVIQNEFYSQHSGNYSVGSLLNSVESISGMDGNDITILTYHNQDKFTQTYPSLIEGLPQDNREFILQWLNYGTSGSPIYNFPVSNFFEVGIERLRKRTAGWVIQGLKQNGIKAYK